MDIDQAVTQFRDGAIAKATCEASLDASYHDAMADAFLSLKSRGSPGRDAFTKLLDDESDEVVSWVAAQLLYETQSPRARTALERIAARDGILAFDARMTLEEFDKGRLESPFGDRGA